LSVTYDRNLANGMTWTRAVCYTYVARRRPKASRNPPQAQCWLHQWSVGRSAWSTQDQRLSWSSPWSAGGASQTALNANLGWFDVLGVPPSHPVRRRLLSGHPGYLSRGREIRPRLWRQSRRPTTKFPDFAAPAGLWIEAGNRALLDIHCYYSDTVRRADERADHLSDRLQSERAPRQLLQVINRHKLGVRPPSVADSCNQPEATRPSQRYATAPITASLYIRLDPALYNVHYQLQTGRRDRPPWNESEQDLARYAAKRQLLAMVCPPHRQTRGQGQRRTRCPRISVAYSSQCR